MSYLHWSLAILSVIVWTGIVLLYFSEQITRWATNRFARPKTIGDLSPEQKAALAEPIFDRNPEPE